MDIGKTLFPRPAELCLEHRIEYSPTPEQHHAKSTGIILPRAKPLATQADMK